MILTEEILKRYNATRISANKRLSCHAPFVNLNFEQNGNVRACCYNTSHILGKWPQQSITEIWQGKKAEELRSYIRQNNFGGGCIECGKMIETGNHQGVRARYYDEFASGFFDNLRQTLTGKINFPRVMEFELSNQCNLECVMCNGYFSSSIRKNREHLPPIVSPYNESFVDELEAFIPHLTDAKFLGGEPFMIDIYLSIWERIRKINPNIRIHITTNGTFLNNRVKELLEGLRAGIIISIDSVNRETYSKIRVNGNYDKVMENVAYFMDYTKRKNTFISIAACPILHNWKELPEMLEFCLAKNIALYFNAVFTPVELSLREQPIESLREMIGFLENYPLPALSGNPQSPRNLSIKAYKDFILQLKGWLTEREILLMEKDARLSEISSKPEWTISTEQGTWSIEEINHTLITLLDQEHKGFFAEQKKLQEKLAQLLIASPENKLAESLNCYIQLAEKYNGISLPVVANEKLQTIATLINQHPKRNSILAQTAQAPPLYFAVMLQQKETEELKKDLLTFFSG
jgi:MoaA/NifB/PqqE/SkfB family radical SAM enzyme